jgi:hypothetical protein
VKIGGRPGQGWTDYLTDEDLAFIRRMVLASGSLKEIARLYGVSYPTVRLRLDRLIEKIRIYEDQAVQSEFERVLRAQYAEGRIDLDTFRLLLEAHGRVIERQGGER